MDCSLFSIADVRTECKFGAEIFLNAYLSFCKRNLHIKDDFTVHMICQEMDKLRVVENVLRDYVSKQKDLMQITDQNFTSEAVGESARVTL